MQNTQITKVQEIIDTVLLEVFSEQIKRIRINNMMAQESEEDEIWKLGYQEACNMMMEFFEEISNDIQEDVK